jgi:hypothetical protein
MIILQDAREAQHMWERKFNNARREGIVLNCGKHRSIADLLGRIINKVKAPSTHSGAMLREAHQAI